MVIRLPKRYYSSGFVKVFLGSLVAASLITHLLPKLNEELVSVSVFMIYEFGNSPFIT